MSVRTEKIASVLKKDLSSILLDYQNNNMITITEVSITPDLGMAKVHISILGGDPVATFAHLQDHNSDIRYKLSKKIRNQMRRMPELLLILDKSAEYSEKMESIFKTIQYSEQPDENSSDSE